MKYSRLLIGFIAIALALWIIIGEQMSGASANAFVNARLVTVRSEVAGTVEMPVRSLGSRIGEGERVATITDPLVDRVRLNDLVMERSFLSSEALRLEAYQKSTNEILQSLEARSERYTENRLEDLRIRLEHARARLSLLEEQGAGDATPATTDAVNPDNGRLPGEPQLPALALDYARERVEVLEIALRAAESGVFLGDGYNDAPNAEQRAVELRSEVAATEAAIADVERRKTAVDERVGRERQRVNGLTGGDILAPVTGLFWEVMAADGEHLERGDPVLKMVDCGSLMVNLSVSEGIYNTLEVGQTAEFRPLGGSDVFDGTVTRLAGAGAATIYRNLAVAPSQQHLERYDVTLLVPGLKDDPELSCAIGRTGRVFFDRRPLDWLRRIF
ncbi:HlyD family efflux transporter periplasmic adaptor subunit [Thalassococcus profundi]|uniref:HlyD family efflux transporter periplasmic adaptor subunit n=1 Tax=Thalassococcus profundi TaxID=2282382 RepID=A0A369TII4_9RHOB|nr:HlyD family secretion protein [Thalassococcus profundi]RDD65050.1 HlyD family efflux transporter periplasmic adaptor subunit [Thalassococcus profundi]